LAKPRPKKGEIYLKIQMRRVKIGKIDMHWHKSRFLGDKTDFKKGGWAQ
jgi:hypothetical protein